MAAVVFFTYREYYAIKLRRNTVSDTGQMLRRRGYRCVVVMAHQVAGKGELNADTSGQGQSNDGNSDLVRQDVTGHPQSILSVTKVCKLTI